MGESLRSFGMAVLAVAVAVGLVLLGLSIAGFSAGDVAGTWAHGAAGNAARWAASLQEACPLLLTGLATAVAFRCGVLNIGAEGQFLAGAVAAVAMTTTFPPLRPVGLGMAVAALAGAMAGSLWAGVAALLHRTRGVPVVLSTILLNFIAIYLVSYLVEGPLHDPGTTAPQSALVPEGLHLPVLMTNTNLHLGVLVAFLLAGASWLVQRQTTFGFELLVTGLNPVAAELAGVPVAARQAAVMLLSGGFAGLGGALQILGVTYFLSPTSSSYGYAGIAVALLGRLHPLGVALAALFFGFLDTGARALERRQGVPHDLADVVKGVIVLAILIGTAHLARRRSRQRQEER